MILGSITVEVARKRATPHLASPRSRGEEMMSVLAFREADDQAVELVGDADLAG
jgi:hypothetical protein